MSLLRLAEVSSLRQSPIAGVITWAAKAHRFDDEDPIEQSGQAARQTLPERKPASAGLAAVAPPVWRARIA
jgi:hypothetical protein